MEANDPYSVCNKEPEQINISTLLSSRPMRPVSNIHLEGESQEEDRRGDVGEDALVEAGREVRVGRVPC